MSERFVDIPDLGFYQNPEQGEALAIAAQTAAAQHLADIYFSPDMSTKEGRWALGDYVVACSLRYKDTLRPEMWQHFADDLIHMGTDPDETLELARRIYDTNSEEARNLHRGISLHYYDADREGFGVRRDIQGRMIGFDEKEFIQSVLIRSLSQSAKP